MQTNPQHAQLAQDLAGATSIRTANDIKQEERQRLIQELTNGEPSAFVPPTLNAQALEDAQIQYEKEKKEKAKNYLPQLGKNITAGVASGLTSLYDYGKALGNELEYKFKFNREASNLFADFVAGDKEKGEEDFKQAVANLEKEKQAEIEADRTKTQWARDNQQAVMQGNQNYNGLGKGLLNAANTASRMFSTSPLGAYGIFGNAAGGAYNQAMDSGADSQKALSYATTSGALETGVEMASGGAAQKLLNIPAVGKINKLTENIANPFIRGTANVVGDVLGEGGEEVITALLDPYIQKATYNPNAGFASWSEAMTDAGNAFVESILPTLLMGGTSYVVDGVNSFTNKQIEKIQSSNLSQNEKQQLINQVQQQGEQIIAEQQKNNAPESAQMQEKTTTNEVIPQEGVNANIANVEQNSANTQNVAQNEAQIQQSLGIDQQKTQVPAEIQTFIDNRNRTSPGLRVEMDSTINTDGVIIKNSDGTRTMRINPKSTRAYEFVAVHEMLHDLENTEAYRELAKFVNDRALTQEGFEKAKAAITEQYQRYYTENGLDMSKLNMEAETTNDMIAQALGNQEFLNELAGQKPTVFMKIYDWFKNVLFDGRSTGKTFSERRADNKFLQELKKKFETAYNTAYRGSQANQYSIQTRTDGTKYIKVDTDQDIFNNVEPKEYNKIAKMYIEDYLLGQTNLAQNDVATIDKTASRKYTNPGKKQQNFAEKMQLTPELKNVLRIAKFEGRGLPTKNDSKYKNWEYYTVNFELGGKMFEGTINIGIDSNQNKHFYEINKIREVSDISGTSLNRSETSLVKNSIPSQSQSVNNISESSFSIGENQPKTDNKGRELTPEQQEYFKDSKIRNEEGKLLEVYHRTNADFNSFDINKIGSATDDGIWGRGFYFSDKDHTHYGKNLKKVYLNITNPFIVNDFKTIKDMADYLDIVESNFNYESDGTIRIRYSQVRQFTSQVQEKGHDGVIVIHENGVKEIVAFEPNQIKNVDNTKPTENPDIRYSQSNDEWAKYLSENWDLMANARKAPTLRQQQAEQEAKRMNLKKPKLEEIAELTAENAQLPKGSYKQKADKMTAYRRKFWDNVESSKIIGQNIKDQVNMTNYERKTNDDTLNKMKERLDTDPVRLTQEWWAKDIKKATDQDIALGAILLERYQQEGRFDEAVDVVQKLADIGTEAGRTVQMYSIFQRLTPEGMQIYQQRKLNSALENITKKQTGKWVEQNKDKFKLTEDDATFITAKVQEAQNAPTERQKQIALAEIEKHINDKLPPEAGQSVKAFRRIAMLFNPKTQVRNIAGNTTVMPLNYVTDLVATGIDKAIAKKTGVRTTTLPSAKTMLQGAKKGLAETWDDYRRGIRTTPTGTKYEIQNNVKSFNENTGNKVADWVNNKLNGIDRILSSVMEAGDRPFYEAAYQNSLQGQMKANGVTEPTQDMIDIASNVALSQTWQDSNNYTQAVLGIRSAFNKINIHGFGLGDLIIPFAKTPANLTKAMVEYSPAGLIPTIINYNDMRKAISRGDMTPMQQKKFVTSVGKAAAGTLLYVLANSLVQSGAITGSSDEDKDVANFEKNVLGIQPYSIRIGDKTYTYNWAQPLAAPLAIMADAHKMSEEGAELNDILLNALKVGGDQLVANSFLQGIQELLSSQYSNESMMDNLVGAIMDLPTQFTPTLLGQIATYTDATKRQTYENGDAVGTMVNEVKNKIPGKKETLAPQVNTFGEEILNYGGDNSAFNVFLNPGNISSANATDTQKELYALYEATQDTTIFPRQAPYSVSGGGEKVSLSSKDRAEYQKASGQYVTKELDALFDSNFYKSLENEQKAEIVNKIVSDADTTAKSKWVETTTTAQLADKQEKLENAGIPLVDYYNSWAAQKDIEGIPGPDGKTLSGSKSRLKKEAIDKATADLDKYQRRVLYEMFNIGESVW